MTRSYEILLKDKEIIYAEVMNEYNRGVSQLYVFHVNTLLLISIAVRLPARQSYPQGCSCNDPPVRNRQRLGRILRENHFCISHRSFWSRLQASFRSKPISNERFKPSYTDVSTTESTPRSFSLLLKETFCCLRITYD
jgi:hypothetical protein